MADLTLFYLLYIPFEFSVYRKWVLKEEPFLLEEFGEAYETYRINVPRWGFRLLPAPAMGHEEVFTWEDYMINREWKRTLSHLVILGLFWSMFLFQNPLLQLPFLTRITVVLAATVWLLIRDTRLQTDREVSFEPIWLAAGLLLTTGGGVALYLNEQFWIPWQGTVRYVFMGLGLLMGLLVVGRDISFVYRSLEEIFDELFPVPDLSYVFLLASAGFLSATTGGLWIGLLLSLLLWSFESARGKPLPFPPWTLTLPYLLLVTGLFARIYFIR